MKWKIRKSMSYWLVWSPRSDQAARMFVSWSAAMEHVNRELAKGHCSSPDPTYVDGVSGAKIGSSSAKSSTGAGNDCHL